MHITNQNKTPLKSSMAMNELYTIVKDFFKQLQCDVAGEKILEIKKVRADFEKIYGKISPYKFSFEKQKEFTDEESDYVTHSHHLMNSISEYLRNKANVALIRLDIGNDLKKELASKLILHNHLVRIDKKITFDHIFKLTFETSMQYTNEHEKLLHTLYVHDNQVIDNFSIEDYPTMVGKKSDIDVTALREGKEVAKEKIKTLLNDRIKIISEKLKISLAKEIERISQHYDSLHNEVQREIDTHMRRIDELSKNTDDDPAIVGAKINRLHETISRLKEKIGQSEIAKEKEFHIREEKQKHSLNIGSRLLNKTIIYYPVFDLALFLENGKKVRQVSLQFNPLTHQIKNLLCEICSRDLSEAFICSSNHLVCAQCGSNCESCKSIRCEKCRTMHCSRCNREVCESCTQICSRCRKHFCKSHVRSDFLNKSIICFDCSLVCSLCKMSTEKLLFKKINGKDICPKCVGGMVMVRE